MSRPTLYEEAVMCFCGHDLFAHDDYGPCAECRKDRARCDAFHGCLVIDAARAALEDTP